MSQRSRARKQKRAKEKTRQTWVFAAGIGVFMLAAAIVYFVFIRPVYQPAVAPERLLLDPVLGNPDAPVTIEEWGAYACPSCKAWHEQGILEQLLERYADDVKLIFRDMPVINPAYDQRAAEVAQCALDQGNDQFWLLHDWLYTKAIQGRTSQAEMVQAGARLGLDETALSDCVKNNTHYQTVQFDLQRGRDLGISGTPTFFINGRRVFEPSQMPAMIEEEIARARG